MLADLGVERGDRVALVLPPTPESAAVMFGVWKLGGILLSMSVLYGDESIQHRLRDSGSKVLVTDDGNAPRFAHDWAPTTWVLGPTSWPPLRPPLSPATPLPTTRRSSTTRQAPPVWPKASSMPTATCSATRSSSTATRWRTASGSTAWASGRGRPASPRCSGPWRLGALQCVYRRESGFDPHKQLAFLSRHQVTNVFTTPTAMRSMMTIADAGSRYPQQFRRVCSAGEPLNPEAIRWFREQYGLTVLDYYGLTESYPLCAQLPVDGRPRGLDGQADAGLGRPDPGRGRAAGRVRRTRRDLPPSPLEPALPARLLEQPGGGPRRRSTAPGSTARTPPARIPTATTGTRAAPTT